MGHRVEEAGGGGSNPSLSVAYPSGPFIFTKGSVISTQSPTVTGGTITSCSSSPAVPTGLTLSTACVLSGTPTAITGSTIYTVTASGTPGTANVGVQITVNDAAPTALSYTGSPYTYVLNTTITSQTPTSGGGTITGCSYPTLPTGLSLSALCVLSGTPTAQTAAANYTITATNTGGSTNTTINIAVNHQQFSQVSAGYQHACAITTGGTLMCWGSNSSGQLGDGTTISHTTPEVINAGTNYNYVSAGTSTTCAITTANALQCWGANPVTGGVGDGTTNQRLTPTVISSGTSFWTISTGYGHSCAITTANVLYCWGDNTYGQIGDGTVTQRLSPVIVDSGTTYGGSTQLATYGTVSAAGTLYMGYEQGYTCAIQRASNKVVCWGSNSSYQLGLPNVEVSGNVTNGGVTITGIGSTTGIVVGQYITSIAGQALPQIPFGTTVTAVAANTVTMSASATAAASISQIGFGDFKS